MKSTCFLFVLVLFFNLFALSQNDRPETPYDLVDTLQEDFGLFTDEEVLNLAIRFDITKYKRKKPKDEYLKAILTYHISKDDSINKKIKLKSRGEFRNSYCSFPPIRLNFKKTDFEDPNLNKLEKVKLVTHCKSTKSNYIFKEYLAYKLYNVLTDYSFRVRLLKIDYINTHKGKNKSTVAYAFMIEPLDLLAERNNAFPVYSKKLSQNNIVPESMDRVAIFNYMIGNTDWSVPNQHNCKILSIPSTVNPGLGLVVPYDFDYSGLVNAHYAIPHENLGIKSVTERIYMGKCREKDEFLKALKEFESKKSEFYKTINEFEYLNNKEKKSMISYLDSFFGDFDKRNSIVYKLLRSCKKL